MAVEIIGGAEVRLDKAHRERLGKDFLAWVTQVEDDRRSMILEVYNLVQENLDGRAPIKSIPWVGASNAFAPLTGTYADALQSRLFEAATAHDPTNLVLPRGSGLVLPVSELAPEGKDYEWFADKLQRISRWIERDEVPHKALMELVTLIMTPFGDSWVYLPWEEQEIADVEILISKDKKTVKTQVIPRKLYSKPMPKVLHPKDVFIRWDAVDHQLERLVGFQFDIDLPTIDELDQRGIYDAEVAAELRKKLQRVSEDASKREYQTGYFRDWGTMVMTPDDYERKQKEQLKLQGEAGTRSIKMLKMFSRVDLDGDGIPEECIFDVVKETGQVAYAKYANYIHRRRPLLHYWFKKRPGAAYNIGVGEMMLNIQDIVNTGLRDHFDNNKVQNTSVFLVRKNSGIEKGKKFYPSATFWVDNPKDAVERLDMGAAGAATSIEAVGLLEKWGQFIVGLSDFQLGQETRSRTPATTTVSLIEEANKRTSRIIDVMRETMREQHFQMLMLYIQNGDPEQLAKVGAAEPEDVELFQQALATISTEDLVGSVAIDPDVSSNSLNRGSRRQEAMALFAQLKGFNDIITLLMQQIAGSLMDPVAKELYLTQARGYIRVMKRVLDTFEERDQREILPEGLIALLSGVTTVEVDSGSAPGAAAGGSTPAEAAQGLVTGEGPAAGPVAPEGRPIAGQPRVPAAASANGGDNG